MSLPDLMVDLETLGVGPRAPIVQIAAVRFDADAGDSGLISTPEGCFNFSCALHPDDGIIEPDTLLWWMRQSDDARRRVFSPAVVHGRIAQGLIAFADWVYRGGRFARVWANSPSFDLRLLKDAWRRNNPTLPESIWPITHRHERDYRTLRKVGESLGVAEPVRVGVEHDALDDCHHQAGHAILILRTLARAKTLLAPPPPEPVLIHGDCILASPQASEQQKAGCRLLIEAGLVAPAPITPAPGPTPAP